MQPELSAGPLAEFPVGSQRLLVGDGHKVALFHRPEGLFALDDHCPHRSGPLSEGWIDGEGVACPWHQWVFRFKDGSCANIPGARVATYPVVVRDGTIVVQLTPLP